ncbi:YetF domain-containing protein [Methanosarcina horonobensis]|uniref:YetF domain-containing protein n=1 Tax=Methanosarcina horonobensis TaxID=418008 RepID=UPI00373FE1DD
MYLQGTDNFDKQSPRYKNVIQGKSIKIISNGILNSKEIGRHIPMQDEVFLLLRNPNIRSLGKIKTVFLERGRNVSVFKLPLENENMVCLQFPKI